MCGVCAVLGECECLAKTIDGLKKLEYRGYDSCGVAFLKGQDIKIVKAVGQIKNLEEKLNTKEKCGVAIGHTRWATHGEVNIENAHPQLSHDGRLAVVHNGIIENYKSLKTAFLSDVSLKSHTDTEILVNLVSNQTGKTIQKLIKSCNLVEGSFAVAMLEKGKNKLFVGKRKSPLMVAQKPGLCMVASDISVLTKDFERCFVLQDDEFAEIDKEKVVFYDKNGKKINKNPIFINNFDFGEEILNDKYFMTKEIKEQPHILQTTIYKYFDENVWTEKQFDAVSKFSSFHFVACGTAYHACLLGAIYVQKLCHKACCVSLASEFRYADNVFDKNCLYVFVSQSGETADTIACAELAKQNQLSTLAVTNVPYCSLNNIVDFVLPTFAGKETAVASTKAYTSQVLTLLILALKLAKRRDAKEMLQNFVWKFELQQIEPDIFENVSMFEKIFFIGRKQDGVTALEGALKLKEIAYLNCIGIAGGELKHGTLALVDDKTLVIAISTEPSLKEKIESNIQEVKARGGKVLLLSNLEHSVDVDYRVKLQNFDEIFMPITSIVPLQFLALQFAVKKGYNPDKPRNLAKSVTVE